MFRGPMFIKPDVREDYGEERWIGIGMTRGHLAFVVFTAQFGRDKTDHFVAEGRL